MSNSLSKITAFPFDQIDWMEQALSDDSCKSLFSNWPPKPILERIETEWTKSNGISLTLKRDDLIHAGISGNKWFKLFHNVQYAIENHKNTLISFGGAWSNHLHALAFIGKIANIKTVAIVRGEEVLDKPSEMIKDCQTLGMDFVPVSRERYRNKASAEEFADIISHYDSPLVIPEGGNNTLGIKGCEQILSGVKWWEYNYIAIAVGTGATCKGLMDHIHKGIHDNDLNRPVTLLAVPVVKGDVETKQSITMAFNRLFEAHHKIELAMEEGDFLGRYGQVKSDLKAFIQQFEKDTNIPLDPVYTGKMFFALYQRIKAGKIPRGSKVLAIHTGGLQGRRGYPF